MILRSPKNSSQRLLLAMAIAALLVGCTDTFNVPKSDGVAQMRILPLSDARLAVVAHGEFEPASIGSYSLRVYQVDNPHYPFDRFSSGLIAVWLSDSSLRI